MDEESAVRQLSRDVGGLISAVESLKAEMREERDERKKFERSLQEALITCADFERCQEKHEQYIKDRADLPKRVSALEGQVLIVKIALGLIWGGFLLFVTLVNTGLIRVGS